jgi:murein DD-endopeptidase MepM/ murein hydrolase activator NlpD
MGFKIQLFGVAKKKIRKNPFFYIIIILIVFVFGVLCFGLSSFSHGNFSSLRASLAKKDPLFAKPANNFLRESPMMAVLGDNSVLAVSPPSSVDTQVLGSIVGAGTRSDAGNSIAEYVVQGGDTLSSIASEYNISVQTILSANNLTSKSTISPGDKLVILPVSGILYFVKSGDTLGDIASIYKGDVSEIMDINELSSETDIYVGDILIIPGGKMPSKKTTSSVSQVPIGSSYFICPHANCYITQGLHFYNAIDFAGKCGDSILAAAGGVVQKIAYGWNGGAGNYVRIEHPNGVVTMYGHLQTILVEPGQQVSQGDRIALMGGKPGMAGAGLSTGCHVHFQVMGARNPFADCPLLSSCKL